MWRQQRWVPPQPWWAPPPYHGYVFQSYRGHFPLPYHGHSFRSEREWEAHPYGYPWPTDPVPSPQLRKVGAGEMAPQNGAATDEQVDPDASSIWESPESPESPWLRE